MNGYMEMIGLNNKIINALMVERSVIYGILPQDQRSNEISF